MKQHRGSSKVAGRASTPSNEGHVWPETETVEDLVNQLKFERARLGATLDSLMDPHVIFEAVRDESGKVDRPHLRRRQRRGHRVQPLDPRRRWSAVACLDILPGHHRSGVFATYVHALETGEPLILDDSIYFNEVWGSERHCDVRALKVGDGLSYTWRDITERVQLNERYRLLAENASDVVYETDPEGLIRWMSPSTRRVLSWQPSDLLGISSFDFIAEDDRAKVRAHHARALRGDYPDAIEARYRSAEGDEHWMSVSARPIRTSAGAIEAIVVGLRGIDAEVATRHSLATSESHFRLLAENSTDVVLETDYEGADQMGLTLGPAGPRLAAEFPPRHELERPHRR